MLYRNPNMNMPERKIPNVSMPQIYGGRRIGGRRPGSMPPITSPGWGRRRRPHFGHPGRPPVGNYGPPWTTQPVPIIPPGQPGPGFPGPTPNPWKPSPQPNPYKHDWRYGYQKAIFGDRSVDPRTYDNWRRKMPRWMRKAVRAGGADWRSHLDDRGRQHMHNLHQNLKTRFYRNQKPNARPPRPRPPRPGVRPPWRRNPPRGRRPLPRRWSRPDRGRFIRPRRGGFGPPPDFTQGMGKTGQYMGYGGGHKAYTGKGMSGKKMPMAGGGTRAGDWRKELG